MKKILIAGLIGGIIVYAWTTLSYTVLNLHDSAQAFLPQEKQAAILQTLATEDVPEGSYLLPRLPTESSMEEQQKFGEEMEGKPWARISYYKAWHLNMGMNMIRGLLADIIMVMLACWMLVKINSRSFGVYFVASIFIGLIAFINNPYTGHIWYPMHDISSLLLDAIVAWGLCGLWLGWYLGTRESKKS